jgi:hypothetical protein
MIHWAAAIQFSVDEFQFRRFESVIEDLEKLLTDELFFEMIISESPLLYVLVSRLFRITRTSLGDTFTILISG